MAARSNTRPAPRRPRQRKTSDQKPPAHVVRGPSPSFALKEIAWDIEAAMNGLELETWADTQGPERSGVERQCSARHVSLLYRVIYDRVARIHAIATSLQPGGAAPDAVVALRPSGGA